MKKKNLLRKIWAVILAVVLCVGMMPSVAFAEEQQGTTQTSAALKFNASDLEYASITYKIGDAEPVLVDINNKDGGGAIWVRDLESSASPTVTITATALDGKSIQRINVCENEGTQPAYNGKYSYDENNKQHSYTFPLNGNNNYVVSLNLGESGSGGVGGNPLPELSEGDICFIKGGNSEGGTIYYSTDNSVWREVNNNDVINTQKDSNVTNGKTIYVKYELNSGYKLDDYKENDISVNNINDGTNTTSLNFNESQVASFVYDSSKTYQVQIRFMQDGGNQNQETGAGNLSTDVTINFWSYEQIPENDGTPVYGYVKKCPKPALEGIRINNFEMFFNKEAKFDTVKNGGYAVDDTGNKNVITFSDAFGAKTDNAYLVNVDGNEVTKISNSDFTKNDKGNGEVSWSLSAEPAESYDIAIVPGVSDDLTVIWTTNYDIADMWIDGEKGGAFDHDMYVEHGNVEVVSIQRGNNTIYKAGETTNLDGTVIDISKDFGYLALKRGDDIVLKLIPDYGYQLASIGGQDVDELGLETKADGEASTFTINNIQNNIHFSSVFVKAENKVDVPETNETVKNAGYSVTGEPVESGTLNMTVNEVTTQEENAVAAVDINLANIFTDRQGNVVEKWTQPITELGTAKAKVTLDVAGLSTDTKFIVKRVHKNSDGKDNIDELPATVSRDGKSITFETDRFSTYTIIDTKEQLPTPSTTPSVPNTPITPTEDYTPSTKDETNVSLDATITAGKAEVAEISQDAIEQVVNTKEGEAKVDTIKIDLSDAKQEVTAVKLSKNTVETLEKVVASKENAVETVTIELTNATVALDNQTLKTLVEEAKGTDIELVVEATEQKSLNKEQQVSLAKYEVATTIEVHITSNGEKIHDFKGGNATVGVKFTPQTGKDPNYYHMIYVADDGTITRYKTKYLDGKILFTTTHFSDYAIIYDETEKNDTEKKEPVQPEVKPVTPVTNFATLKARSAVQTNNSIKLQWNKVAKADGYFIYGGSYSTKEKKYTMKLLATVSDNSKLTWTHKKLTKVTNYKYKVKAYKLLDGKKVIIANSVDVFAVTKGGKYGVAKRVDLMSLGNKKNTNLVTLAKGKTVQIKAKAVKADKPIKNQGILQYESSNKMVATVTKDGKIKAVGKGTCYIYIYALNGVYKTVKVTVK